MLISEFDAFIRNLLPFDLVGTADPALNGLQVGRREREIKKAVFAVDASLETFRRAAENEADLLFAHHGLFFGGVKPVTGTHYARLAALVEYNLALYAVHLPLDMAPEIGNNAGIARKLKLDRLEPFGQYHGVKIGLKGVLPETRPLSEIVRELCGNPALPPSFLAFGPETVSRVGIVSGGAPENARDAIEEGLDLFITGERSHEIYHECREAGLNVLFAGHYLSEVYGVEAVCRVVGEKTGLETVFLDVPTGL